MMDDGWCGHHDGLMTAVEQSHNTNHDHLGLVILLTGHYTTTTCTVIVVGGHGPCSPHLHIGCYNNYYNTKYNYYQYYVWQVQWRNFLSEWLWW